MLQFITLLFIINVISFAYTVHVLLFGVKGLQFLEYTKGILLENDDVEELDTLTKNDIPLMVEYLLSTKGMLYFILMTMIVNIIMTMFVLFPVLYATTGWTIMVWTAALTNAFIIISFKSYRKMKIKIDATCISYNVIIQSYQYISEYEENNNDSSE